MALSFYRSGRYSDAIKSGQAVAQSIVASVRRGADAQKLYVQYLRDVQLDLGACTSAAQWFYGAKSMGFGALSTHPARTSLMRGFAAGKTFHEILRTALFSPFYSIEPVRSVVEFERKPSTRQPVTSAA